MKKLMIAAALAGLATTAVAQQRQKVDPAVLDKYFQSMFGKANDDWKARVTQDQTLKDCDAHGNAPPPKLFDEIVAREKATVKFPADGNVLGDWKKGLQVANRGTGGQFSDAPGTYQGGNCYACHEMAPTELSYGTLGPSLKGYGKARNFSKDEAKATFAKVYNAQSVMACSQMPRFGHTKFLTEEQIKDVVAFLFDPESPVNK